MSVLGLINSALLPFIGTAIGAAAALFGGYLQHTWATRRDAEARAENRSADQNAARSRFQHETLVQLQDAMMQLARLTGKGHFQDTKNFHASQTWQKLPIDDDTAEEHAAISRKLIVFISRIEDEKIRRNAEALRDNYHNVMLSKSMQISRHIMLRQDDRLSEINQMIGQQLRILQT